MKRKKHIYIISFILSIVISPVCSHDVSDALDAVRLIKEEIIEKHPRSKLIFSIIPKTQKKSNQQLSDKKFPILNIELGGNTIFTDNFLIDKCIKIQDNQTTIKKLHSHAQCITDTYIKNGYILSLALLPTQKVADGNIKIMILEGYISNLEIENISDIGKNVIKNSLDNLVELKPLYGPELERRLLVLNEYPGLSVQSYIKPSIDTTGASDLHIIHSNKRFEFIFGLDNRISTRYGNISMFAGGYLNLTELQSKTGILFKTTNKYNSINILNISHKQYFGVRGFSLDINGFLVRSRPNIEGMLLETEKDSISLSAQYPIILSRNCKINIALIFDGVVTATMLPVSGLKTKDKVRTLRGEIVLKNLDNYQGSNSIKLAISQGLPIIYATRSDDLNVSRSSGSGTYSKINWKVERNQLIKGPFSVLVGFEGQFSFSDLLALEEFNFGGHEYGRGFDNSTIVGDNGIEGKIELAYIHGFSLFKKSITNRYYLFNDIGFAWDQKLAKNHRAYGVTIGLGLQTQISNKISTSFELAKPVFTKGIEHKKNKFKMIFSVTAWT